MNPHYAAVGEDGERKDMESPHDEVTSARSREINNHDTYFALALIYNVCETQLQVSNSSIYSLVCSFVGRHHGDISIYLHHMMF